jgi:hypothetical protein
MSRIDEEKALMGGLRRFRKDGGSQEDWALPW